MSKWIEVGEANIRNIMNRCKEGEISSQQAEEELLGIFGNDYDFCVRHAIKCMMGRRLVQNDRGHLIRPVGWLISLLVTKEPPFVFY